MTTPSESANLILKHKPYGEQHPYLPLPCERFPRDPAAGERVTLGVETRHSHQADRVWCTWQVAGSPAENRTEAVNCDRGETTDTWQIHLPAFNGGDLVSYRLFASGAGQQVETEPFTFSVNQWLEITRVEAVEETAERLAVELATENPGLFVRFEIEPGPTDTLTFKVSAPGKRSEKATPAAKNEPVSAAWGDIQVSLEPQPAKLIFSRERDGLIVQNNGPMRVLVSADGKVLQYELGFESPAQEAFYGFGERFNALDQRGNHLDNYVYGQYTGQGKRSYIPIPFFISSRGYGLWLNTERQAEFDLAAADPTRWALIGRAEDEDAGLEMKFFFQPHPRAIVQAFTDLTGKPKLPPTWVFGPWMSSNDWNSQEEVLRQLHLTQTHQIPASVLVIEAWSDEINFYIWNDAQYQQKPSAEGYRLSDFVFPPEGRWPDPKAMTDALHQAGLRLVLWQNPAIKHAEPREKLDERLNKADQAYAVEQGFVVTKADGSPHRVEAHMPWFGNSLVLDFTNPKAAEWWFKKREYLVKEVGVDGFKSDGGEHIWDVETRFANGMRGSRGINHYPVAYERAYQRFMESLRGDDFVLFSRAGYTGIQQVPCHWAGDENSTWDAFRASIRAMLNAGLCGIPMMGWDIAGFAGPIPSSELYLRAAAFSVFCPIMQYHSDVNGQRKPSRDRTPWNIQEQTDNPDVIALYRAFANLRMNILPYILSQAAESSQSGLPLMRALPLEYPQDDTCREFPYEYLFGDALLIAPVTQEDVYTWPVYLPEGEWRDLWTGKIHQGPVTFETAVPFDRIPVFQKKGSLLALNLNESSQLGSPVGNRTDQFDHLTLQLFPAEVVEATLYQPAEKSSVRLTAESKDGTIVVELPALGQAVNLVICETSPVFVTVDGKAYPRLDAGSARPGDYGWQWDAQSRETQVYLPASPQITRIVIH